jgi:hypothetical protein
VDRTCQQEGGPSRCPYIVVACYCGEVTAEDAEGYGGHDVCGGCGDYPDECDCFTG